MVLMNLFAGQEERCRHRKQICGHSREMRGWEKLGEAGLNSAPTPTGKRGRVRRRGPSQLLPHLPQSAAASASPGSASKIHQS